MVWSVLAVLVSEAVVRVLMELICPEWWVWYLSGGREVRTR